jgi:hypothetical protein
MQYLYCGCTVLAKIMLTLMKIRDISDLKDTIRTVVSSVPRKMCVRALYGTVAGWLLCVNPKRTELNPICN